MEILSGRKIVKKREKMYQEAVKILNGFQLVPHLVILTFDNDPASKTYIRQKERQAERLGIQCSGITLDGTMNQTEFNQVVLDYSNRQDVHGIIIQLPIPETLDLYEALEYLDPLKDVDGLHPLNLGRLAEGRPQFIPCTPYGIMELMSEYDIPLSGQHCVIVGRSQIVGRPLALALSHEDCTVTLCHSKTRNLGVLVSQADILVTATGNPTAIDPNWIHPDTVVIDVSMNRREDGTLRGDIEPDELPHPVRAITPVPGGVGPMTVMMLMEQVITATCLQHEIQPQLVLGRKNHE